jgi:hypothetical protein
MRMAHDYVIAIEPECGCTLQREGWDAPRGFTMAGRAISHTRHWHKYALAHLPRGRGFHFRDARGLTGRVAGNVTEFLDEIAQASLDVLRHHAAHGDFSRWLGDLCRDGGLVDRLRLIEAALVNAASSEIEYQRTRLRRAVRNQFRP